jgi:colanic acid/amylovoran biosynthesis glycosyltransferase
MMSEAFIANSAAALIDQGHSVDIFGVGNVPATGLSVKAVERHQLEQHTVNMRWPTSTVGRLTHLPAALGKLTKKHGFAAMTRLSPSIYRRSLLDLSAVYQASAIKNAGEYDILHCQFATIAESVIKHRKAGFLKGNIVVNFRGYDISETVSALGPHLYDHVWPEASSYIANCDYFRRRAIELGCPPDRIDVIGSGIRLENFPFEPKSPDRVGPIRFLMVGRLIERKGMHIALQALSEYISRNQVEIAVDIIGDGVMRSELETLTTQLGLANMVTFHGARDHSEIADQIRKTDVFLAPSMTSANGGQDGPVNTLKEAMAIGRPVVGTRHGGIPELVGDGITGALADEGDVADLCAAIERLIHNRAAWPTMVQRGRDKVEAMYGLERCTNQLIKHYERCLSEDAALSKIPTSTAA